MPHWKFCRQLDKAMIHSSHRDSKTKAIAEALAMIADAHPELDPHRPRPVPETDEWLWESATEFCAVLDHYAGRSMEIKRAFAASRPTPTRAGRNSPKSKTGLDLRPGSAAPPHALTPAAPSAHHAP
jgi:hypothetical protein